jgi:hypothetical protein
MSAIEQLQTRSLTMLGNEVVRGPQILFVGDPKRNSHSLGRSRSREGRRVNTSHRMPSPSLKLLLRMLKRLGMQLGAGNGGQRAPK